VVNEYYNQLLRCVVIGTEKLGDNKKKEKYYVLIVREFLSTGDAVVYKRVGVGYVLGRFIKDETWNALI